MKTLKDYYWTDKKELIEQINAARDEYSVVIDVDHDVDSIVTNDWIPFNLERMYLDLLIKERLYDDAMNLIKRMKLSYRGIEQSNFIEVYEYRLLDILHLDNDISIRIEGAKKEFNKYTLTLISVIVGLITIFGIAGSTLSVGNGVNPISIFFALSLPILILVIATLHFINKR